MSEHRTGGRSGKLAGLDILRFFSAFAILIWHYQHFSFVGLANPGFIADRQPLYRELSFFYHYGSWAVFVFWCISGYVFFWKYREPIVNRRVSGRDFFVFRFSRLYPLHLATLLGVAALQLMYVDVNKGPFVVPSNDLWHFLLQLGMASHWAGFGGGFSFNGPIWSVSLEVLVYLLFYLHFRFLGKSVFITLFVVALSIGNAVTGTTGHPIVPCISMFYIGGLTAIVAQYLSGARARRALGPLAIAALIAMPLAAAIFNLRDIANFSFYFVMLYTPVVLYVLAELVRLPAVASKFVEAAGNLTYASYLLHFPVQVLIALTYSLAEKPIPVYSPVFFMCFLVFTLVLSCFVFRFFEVPARDWIRKRCAAPARSDPDENAAIAEA